MTTQLRYLRPLLPALASLALAACATASPKLAAQDVLLKDIAPTEVSLYASQDIKEANHTTCQTFYANTVNYVGQPAKTSSEEVLETVFLAALAGGATYGVGALGITNAFAALSLAASTNQVVYEGGKAALDANETVKTDLSPDVEIADAAMRLGCPQPSKAALKLALIESKENKKTARKLAKIKTKEKKLAGKLPVCREDVQSC